MLRLPSRPPTRAIFPSLIIFLIGCAGAPAQLRPATAAQPQIRQLSVGDGTNAYVVMGERPILVDTGWGAKTAKLEKALAELQLPLNHLQLIVLTHGHGDHAGGALRMRTLTGAQVVVGAGDVAMLAAGHNRPLKPMGFVGRLIRGFSDKPFPPLSADIVIDAELDLRPYGIDGKILPAPGHTPGALVVLLENGDAIVGDLLRGDLTRSHAPARHFFHDDCAAAEGHITPLIQAGARRFFVGHGGPIDAATAQDYFKNRPCPKP